jgi:hypothetical protein
VRSGHEGERVCRYPASKAQFWGVPFGTTVEEVKGDAGVRRLRQWGGGCVFANARPGRRGLGQNPKPSVSGLISDAPCKTAVWGNGGR